MPATELITYFAAERIGGFVLVGFAVAAFVFAATLWLRRSSYKAMLWPLVAIGLVEFSVGISVAIRAPAQVEALTIGLGKAPLVTARAESERIAKVNSSFAALKVVEVVSIAIGLVLALVFPRPGTWSAVGLGLALQAGVLLIFDFAAQERAIIYLQWLQKMAP
jgi:hypothetical protein